MWLSILILIRCFPLLPAQKTCSLSHCNYEGECVLQNGAPTCNCIGTSFFKGPHCDQMVDNCQPNPCHSSVPCTNVIGYFLCAPCPPGYAGTKCDQQQQDFLSKLYMHYNRIGNYGEQHTFLITAETLGSTGFNLELSTVNNQVEAFSSFSTLPNSKLRWQKSDDLVQVARGLGLRHADALPYSSGYYHVCSSRFWIAGVRQLHLVVTDAATASTLFHDAEYALLIMKPANMACVPQMLFSHCSNPQQLLQVDVARYNTFELRTVQQCGSSSQFAYHWWVHTALGTSVLHDFGVLKRPYLKLPPYFLRSQRHGAIYSIQVEVKGQSQGQTLRTRARCYLTVMPKPIQAIITGGTKRDVFVGGSFEMDSSKSRDYALAPNVKQQLSYTWDCITTDDADNRHCHSNLSSLSRLRLPVRVFEVGKIYNLKLSVSSQVNLLGENISAQQALTPVDRRALYVDIKCVRNCAIQKYVSGKLLHLLAQCLNCVSDEAIQKTYSWTVHGNVESKHKYLVYTPASQTPSLDVTVTVHSGYQWGKASIKLTLDKVPSGGECVVTPTSGTAYETEFYFKCSGFVDTDGDLPLNYQYLTDDLALIRTTDTAAYVRLPQVERVQVIICDSLFACTEQSVAVNVAPLQTPTDVPGLEKFFAKPENNLQELLHQGDSERVMVLLYVLIGNANSLEMAEYINSKIGALQLFTLLEVEQMAGLIKKLVDKLQPLDHKKAALCVTLFDKLVSGFKTVIKDGEVQELQMDNYKTLTNHLINLMADFAVELEEVPPVDTLRSISDPHNPLYEEYPQLTGFDVTALRRINSWLGASKSLHILLSLMGVVGAFMQEPDEDSLIIDVKGVRLHNFCIQTIENRQIKGPDNVSTFLLSSELLNELQGKLGSTKICLQVVSSTQANPFWWYPDEQPVSTGVNYFMAYSKLSKWNVITQVKNPLEFSLKLKPPLMRSLAMEPIVDRLNSYYDMPIYKIAMPSSSLLVVTFVQISGVLRIKMQLDIYPYGYQVRHSGKLVSASNTTFVLTNIKAASTTAYLAVLAADAHDPKVSYSFTAVQHVCQSFNFNLSQPSWSSYGCLPLLNADSSEAIYCRCQHLSNFAGRIVNANVQLVARETLLQEVPLNWHMLLFYALLILALLLLFLWARKNQYRHRDKLIIEPPTEAENKNLNMTVRIYTGTKWLAGTTANVSLTFIPHVGPPRQFTIYQDPADPQLTRSSMCSVQLPISSNVLARPIKLDVRHDNTGRYPSWFLDSIELVDAKAGYQYTFRIRKWIKSKVLSLTEDTHIIEETKWEIFQRHCKQLVAQWFQINPITGPWKHAVQGPTHFERTCIWITKLSVYICIVACYFGRTTLQTYEEERDYYRSLRFECWHILALVIVCWIAGFIVQMGLESLL